MRDILLVGCGNMGFAMLSGWIENSPKTRFWVVEPNEALRARAAEAGAETCAAPSELPQIAPEFVFLAVKPQVMPEVAPSYRSFEGAVFVSVAAGVSMEALEGWLGAGAALIRTMPNTPAAIGEGMLVSCANDAVEGAQKRQVDLLLSHSGQTGWIEDEALMDAVTAISGSGPAYVFHFIEALAAAGRDLGLPPDLSDKLALQTVAGAGLLARGAEDSPAELRRQVTSPGGTTQAALEHLMEGLGPLLNRSARAARDRGRELGKA